MEDKVELKKYLEYLDFEQKLIGRTFDELKIKHDAFVRSVVHLIDQLVEKNDEASSDG